MIISENSVERYKSLGERHRRGLNEIVKTVRGYAWKKEDLLGSRIGDKVGVILSILALVVSQGFGWAIDPGPINPLGKQKIVLYTTGALVFSLFILEINAMARPMTKLIYTIAVITTLCHLEQGAMKFFLGATFLYSQYRSIKFGYQTTGNAVRGCYESSHNEYFTELTRKRLPLPGDLQTLVLEYAIEKPVARSLPFK